MADLSIWVLFIIPAFLFWLNLFELCIIHFFDLLETEYSWKNRLLNYVRTQRQISAKSPHTITSGLLSHGETNHPCFPCFLRRFFSRFLP